MLTREEKIQIIAAALTGIATDYRFDEPEIEHRINQVLVIAELCLAESYESIQSLEMSTG